MNTQTKKTIQAASVNARAIRQYEVGICLGTNIIGRVVVSAKDQEQAKEKAFVSLNFKVKKAY